jgi:DNA ligase-associated metallophosphoesterase
MRRKGDCELELCGESFLLLPEKAIFWEERGFLMLADLHLGKARHFRKSGFAVPDGEKNFLLLSKLIQHFQPEKVLFLGDLFHSTYNEAIGLLEAFMQKHPTTYELIIGNHDILAEEHYARLGMELTEGHRQEGPFCLCHEPMASSEGYVLSGHIHPGVRLQGRGRQSLRLPCFHFGESQGILPAFGSFTGLHMLQPEAEDQVFVVLEDEVCKIS